mmetsp:Transcript_112984/g.326447  ORF Transcript_112984/g.326447 Transcript_112984/m.326447 type:complete len:246 (+) Transcript_112984:387-1124(+)
MARVRSIIVLAGALATICAGGNFSAARAAGADTGCCWTSFWSLSSLCNGRAVRRVSRGGVVWNATSTSSLRAGEAVAAVEGDQAAAETGASHSDSSSSEASVSESASSTRGIASCRSSSSSAANSASSSPVACAALPSQTPPNSTSATRSPSASSASHGEAACAAPASPPCSSLASLSAPAAAEGTSPEAPASAWSAEARSAAAMAFARGQLTEAGAPVVHGISVALLRLLARLSRMAFRSVARS